MIWRRRICSRSQATTTETNEVFNVGTGQGQSVYEVIKACETVSGKKVTRELAPRRPGDPPALVADPKKLMEKLGWKPKYTSIEETVATAWAWHQANPNGYGPRERRGTR